MLIDMQNDGAFEDAVVFFDRGRFDDLNSLFMQFDFYVGFYQNFLIFSDLIIIS